MSFALVVNRRGQVEIHWPGVLLTALIISAVYAAGVALMSLTIGWFSFGLFVILPFLLGLTIATNVKRELKLPARDLPTIG